MSGKIHLIIGPMFSGKTTELIRLVRRHKAAGRSYVLVKHEKDNRREGISTHDEESILSPIKTSSLMETYEKTKDADIIGIDEGQFFSDLVDYCVTMANCGKIVIVAALDGTFQQKPFGKVCELVPECEDVMKLKAVCVFCHNDASFSMRITDEKKIVSIGGKDQYCACCRGCLLLKGGKEKAEKKIVEKKTDDSVTVSL